jgi:DNA-directed RNA polymerase II subunit RPB9
MLYPRENRRQQSLEYYCKQPNCGFVLPGVEDSCVFRNEIVKDSTTRLEVINSDLRKDPSLQRMHDVYCTNCGHDEAVFFLAEQNAKSKVLSLVYICCECGHKWLD